MIRARVRRLLAAAALVAAACLLASSPAAAEPGWRMAAEPDQRPVRYTIEAELTRIGDEDSPRQIKGRETIEFVNTSPDPVDTLWFHLYANAFRDGNSAFLRERRRDGGTLPEPMAWGGTDIQRIVLLDAPAKPPEWAYVPAPDAPDDHTVLRVKLARPVESKGQVQVMVDFTTTLPKPVARMGAVKDFVFAAQWFPKLGRFLGPSAAADPAIPERGNLPDGWYCPHYHASGEFSADFGDFDVTLKVPSNWTVGSTGVPAGADVIDEAAGLRTRRVKASSVVDFAWTAGARTREIARTIDPDGPGGAEAVSQEIAVVRSLLGLGAEAADLPPVEVVLLLQPEHMDQAERHFEAARAALALFGTWLGPYPYPRLTIVDPAFGAAAVGGMEYPTLVTAGTSVATPESARRPEHVVIHEIGHQWFMSLLASNEVKEAWLDEALTSWFTARAMHRTWGPSSQLTTIAGVHFPYEMPWVFPGLADGWSELLGLPGWARPKPLEGFRLWRDGPTLLGAHGLRYRPDQDPFLPSRRSWNRAAGWDEMFRASHDFASGRSYRGNAYPRGVLLLESIARHVRASSGGADELDGERRVLRAFREYARQYRFRHPTSNDLFRVLAQETALPDLRKLVDSLARTTGALDYAVESVRVVEPAAAAPGAADPPQAPAEPVTEITLRRRGEITVPVTVRIDLHDTDADVLRTWDGAGWTRFTVPGRVKTVEIDPARLFPQDANLSNNVWTDRRNVRPGVKAGVHALLWLENALTGWGRFF